MNALEVIDLCIRDMVDTHGKNVAIISGCAGMTALYSELNSEWEELTIIDPVAAGLRLSSVLCLE